MSATRSLLCINVQRQLPETKCAAFPGGTVGILLRDGSLSTQFVTVANAAGVAKFTRDVDKAILRSHPQAEHVDAALRDSCACLSP
jgi:hypothetical protein